MRLVIRRDFSDMIAASQQWICRRCSNRMLVRWFDQESQPDDDTCRKAEVRTSRDMATKTGVGLPSWRDCHLIDRQQGYVLVVKVVGILVRYNATSVTKQTTR